MDNDRGFTLVEALVATALGSLLVAGAAGLVVISATAVQTSTIKTTAVLLTQQTIEAWRSGGVDQHGERRVDGVLVRWQAMPTGPSTWRLEVTASGPRLGPPIVTTVIVGRATP